MTQAPARYCPDCGSPTDTRRIEGRDRRYCPDCESIVWQNPIPFASVAVVDGDSLLLARRAIEPGAGEWNLPGGFLEADEQPAGAAARELQEEVSLSVDPGSLTLVDAVTEGPYGDRYPLAILYAISRDATVGDPVAGSETSEVVFDELADASEKLLRPHLRGRLADLVAAVE